MLLIMDDGPLLEKEEILKAQGQPCCQSTLLQHLDSETPQDLPALGTNCTQMEMSRRITAATCWWRSSPHAMYVCYGNKCAVV